MVDSLTTGRRSCAGAGWLPGLFAVAIAGCTATSGSTLDGVDNERSMAIDPPAVSAEVDPSIWPQITWPLTESSRDLARVNALLRRMSIEDKVGQLVQADINSITPDQLRQYRLGSILAGGNSGPGGRPFASAQDWLALADAFHAASIQADGVAIPVLFGIDAVHGHNNVIGATIFPHNIGLGAGRNPDLVRLIAQATAREIRVTGMEWTFAPTLAVPRDLRWGRTYEGYSEDPAIVASFATAVVEGLQGRVGDPDFLGETRVAAGAKHFIGDGGTSNGRDQGDAAIDEAGLRDIHGAGYPAAIAAGTQTVMASFSSWNGVKLHGHRGLLSDVLKQRMGFRGFVVGDWNGHGQVPGCSNTDCPQSLAAGLDMYMAPDSWQGLYESLLAQARSGAISSARLDDAVARILLVKLRLGLFDAPPPSQRALGGRFELIGHDQHRSLARQAVRESLVLLKNQRGLLPLRPDLRIGIAGDGADHVGKQSGGWTLTWQGTDTDPEHFPGATSIWAGLREQIQAAGGSAELAIDGQFERRPEVAVVVIGEDPYAEFQGDLEHLGYRPGDDRDLALIRRLRAQSIPVVTVFLSGRPLWLNREINASNAFVAAWLPGSEGGGIADVLLRDADGEVQHDFHGRLPYAWPRTIDQSPQRTGEADYDPLFPLGYGLSYSEPTELAELDEDPGRELDTGPAGLFFGRGELARGWQMRLRAADGTFLAVAAAGASASSDDGLQLRRVDHQAQEDALRLDWHRDGGVFGLHTQTATDLNRETNGDVALLLTLRLESPVVAPVQLGVSTPDGSETWLPLHPLLAGLPVDQWHRISIMLKCFQAAGSDMSRVDGIALLRANAGQAVSLSRIELGSESGHRLSCTGR